MHGESQHTWKPSAKAMINRWVAVLQSEIEFQSGYESEKQLVNWYISKDIWISAASVNVKNQIGARLQGAHERQN